ncbi:zinc-ribbon domain-containing protein [Methanococcus maripaludis]|uniref:TM2 domain-containing membrane protein YozV n=1 Tax=Methanococcus maripaludis TaxID=39152 RepID=A0A2L1C8S3_METMI|nr:zinc ribbon domain-containing protein [Methanococcus maripaludis]AVB75745.1 hypothetical protein MMJJ_03280 [Methanococcus maripaludis]MBA2864161.1 TM2 domain-containing membrane protein YozV [Methanococcus maripaludis]MBB6497087.1 TM2 domain-containing membrane protein YozV [Methanococcus maripaludis]
MHCTECGSEVFENEKFCHNCGAKISRNFKTDMSITTNEVKEPAMQVKTIEAPKTAKVIAVTNDRKPTTMVKIIAIILSIFLPGVGHMILGGSYINKGLWIFIGTIACAVTSFLILPILILMGLWIYAIFDLAKVQTID